MSYKEAYRQRAIEVEQAQFLAQTKRELVVVNDIDPYGKHLHHTGALKIFEAERARIFEEHAMPLEEMAAKRGIYGFVREIVTKYADQVYEGDKVEVLSRVFKTRPATLSFHQIMARDSKLVVLAIVDSVLVGPAGPIRIPQEVIDNLKQPAK